MSKRISIGALALIVIIAMLLTFMTTYTVMSGNAKIGENGTVSDELTEEQQAIVDKLVSLDNIYKEFYIGDLDYDKILDYVLYGYTSGTGDKYSSYMNAEDYAKYNEDATGDMQGIGVNVISNTENNFIEIVNIMGNSPAEAAGIQVGDMINTVGGKNVAEIGYDAAIDLMLGEAGTVADFTVLRGENPRETIPFSITRASFEAQDVFYHVYAADSSVGIIRIDQFTGKAFTQFTAAVEALQEQGVTKFVFDVRNNPGGDLNVICNILDYLLPEGPIIHSVDKDGNITQTITSDAEHLDAPIAVLTNGNTASAAELFSCALQDYAKRGELNKTTLVGTTTYGKGIMQSILDLKDGTGLKLSTSMYNPPYSENYDGVGVVPDIEVELDEALLEKSIYKITDEEDNQLKAAIDTLS